MINDKKIEELKKIALLKCKERIEQSKTQPKKYKPHHGITSSLKNKYGL